MLSKILEPPINKLFKKFLPQFLLNNYLVWGDASRLKIAKTAKVNNALFNLSSGSIIIEEYVFFGHNVSVLTGMHNYQKTGRERQIAISTNGKDVTIKKGVWVASNAVIIGPSVIGENSVIGAGCIVHGDVPANSVCSFDRKLTTRELLVK